MNANDEAGPAYERILEQCKGHVISGGGEKGGADMPSGPPPRTPRSVGSDLASVGRFLWTHNPFYIVSAFLTLYGLKTAFGEAEANSWWLLGVLVGYTALMAAAGFIVVRWGKVWDDARSILLMVVVLLLALSVSFDEIGIHDPKTGIHLLLVGLACAIFVSEGLLCGIGIRLRAWYRAAYYVLLALFFLYPIIPMALKWHDPMLAEKSAWWVLLSFPVAGAAGLLFLLPAVRRGKSYARRNGTPWRWPWFPWVLFGLLGAGVCVRAYMLSLSLYWVRGMATPFGLYFLLPIVFAIALLLIEGGLRQKNRRAQIAALLLPVLAVLFSFPGSGGSQIYREFLRDIVIPHFGSPVPLAVGAGVIFYLYAALRRVRGAEWGLAVALLAGSFIDGETIGLSTLATPQWLPLLLLAALEGVQGVRRRSSARLLLALAALMLAASPALPKTWPAAWTGVAAIHVAVLGVMAIGLLCPDKVSRQLLSLAAFAVAALPLAALVFHGKLFADAPVWLVLTYCAAMTALPLGYWRLTRNTSFLTTAIANAFWLTGGLALRGWREARHALQFRGAYPIIFGALSFIAALAISLAKGRKGAQVHSRPGNAVAHGGRAPDG